MNLIWLAAACLVATMFFSAAEMAFIAANRLRLRHLAEEGSAIAEEYLEAFRRPERLLSAAMMGVTIAHIVAGSAVTFALLPRLGGWAWLVAAGTVTPVMLIFGEIIPKAVAREWATSLILRLYRPLKWIARLLTPFVALANAVVSLILKVFGGPQPDTRQFVSREELKALLQLEPGEAANVVGVITSMDLLRRGGQAHSVVEIMRPPTFVPETKRIDDLLREMQKSRNQLAIVVDEYGGATGIVTLEDIVEQIVGEIHDEHDRTPASVERLPDGSYWVAARAHIDELNEALDWTLPKQDYETVAGLVLATLHRIPRTGEEFQIPGYTITVLEADARRVGAVKITPLTAPAATAGAF